MTMASKTSPLPATPLPPYAMAKPYQYRHYTDPRGQGFWAPLPRLRRRKNRGACAGAFGGQR